MPKLIIIISFMNDSHPTVQGDVEDTQSHGADSPLNIIKVHIIK
jgi:hypothetical protein